MQPRLKSSLYVQALLRRCEVQGAHGYVVRRGAEEAGAVFLKINRLDGTCLVLSPAEGAVLGCEGGRVWTKPLGDAADEKTADVYFSRQAKFDPDIWLVEIEDREGRSFVDERIV